MRPIVELLEVKEVRQIQMTAESGREEHLPLHPQERRQQADVPTPQRLGAPAPQLPKRLKTPQTTMAKPVSLSRSLQSPRKSDPARQPRSPSERGLSPRRSQRACQSRNHPRSCPSAGVTPFSRESTRGTTQRSCFHRSLAP